MPNEENTQEKKQNLDINRTRLIRFGILSGIIVVLFGLLFLFVFLGSGSWKKGMSTVIQNALDKNSIGLTVFDMDSIQSGSNSTVVSFSLTENGKLSPKHGVAVRMSTLYGSLPIVYLFDARTQTATFLDALDIDGVAKKSIVASLKQSQIYHWEKRIPKIMRTARNVNLSGQED